MEAAEGLQQPDEMYQLIDTRAVHYRQHPVGHFLHVPGRNLKAGVLILHKVPYILYFRQLKERFQGALCVEEDIQRLDLLPALGCKIGRIAFEYMGQVGAEPIDLV